MKHAFVVIVCLISLAFVFIPHIYAANFTVNDAASLIAAINTANTNGQADVITLDANIALTAASDFTEGVNGLPSILADGGSSLTIEGKGFTLSRSGAATFRIMHISAGANVFINDLTIENGLANAGGIGSIGGAIFTRGQLTINNSVFSANSADAGASGFGGAIMSFSTNLTVGNSSFRANTGGGYGGAVYVDLGTALLSGNTFSNNTAAGGGAVGGEGGANISFINNTISGNTATSQGGGIYTIGSAALMQNNTLTNNTAGTQGGGIYNLVSTITLQNNIIAGNNAPTGSQCFNDTIISGSVINADSYNILGSGGSAGGCPAGATDIVPAGAVGTILGPLANNYGPTLTHALVTGSPALDAANLSNCPSADQRGFLRGFNAVGAVNNPQIGDCDIGAFEFSLDPAYASNPAVGSMLVVGSTAVGTEISTTLAIIEAGSAALTVSLNSITGANAGDFTIIGLPTAIGDGNPPQTVAIICKPSAAGLGTAQITFNTNDPNQNQVSYTLQCTGTNNLVARASILGINQIVTEANTAVTVTVQLDVPAGFSDTRDVTVTLVDAAAGNATSGVDYTAFPATTVTFTGSLTAGSLTQTVTVNLLNDSAVEGAEALTLIINQVTGAAEIGLPDAHTIIINDNDANIFAQASFAANSAIINEDAGTLSVNVQLFIPAGYNLMGNVTVTISDGLSGTATSGTDYTAFAPVTLTFVDAPSVAGTTYTQTVTLNILDDTLIEGTETIELAMTGLKGPVDAVSPAAFTAIINDGVVVVAKASLLDINQIVTESNTAITVTVQLEVPAGFKDTRAITVEVVDAAAGNATSGTDYMAFPATTVTFAGPLTAGTNYTQTVTVSILDDPAMEGAETLALRINQVTGMPAIGFPDTHTIIINDVDANTFTQLSFVANSALINEDAGTMSVDVQLFIPVGYSLTGNVTVTISDGLSGNATSGADYKAFTPVTLTFVDAPFVVGTTYTQTVTLDILDDTLIEGAETVDLAITGLTGPVEAVSPTAFTAIINDDEIGL